VCFGFGACALRSRRLLTPCRRRHRSRPERGIGVEELVHHRQQVVERHQQRPAQRHHRQCGRQRRLQPMRRMTAIFNAVAVASFVNRLFGRPGPVRENPRGIIAGLDRGADFRRGRGLLVKPDLHASSPLQTSSKTHLAMKSAERREAIACNHQEGTGRLHCPGTARIRRAAEGEGQGTRTGDQRRGPQKADHPQQ
jgi:hypothetical protein